MRKWKLAGCIFACAGLLISCGQKNNDSGTSAKEETGKVTTTEAESVKDTVLPTEKATQEALQTTAPNDAEGQLKVIADNKEMWLTNEKYSTYSYAVTDLNQDGRLEIVESVCEGTGIYTYTNIYEVSGDDSSLIQYESLLDEFTSQADLITEKATVYYDKENNIYHYIFEDLAKNGAAEYYENIRDWSLQNGQIIEKFLAYRDTLYNAEGNAAITCEEQDADGNRKEITEEEYNAIAEKRFAGMEKKTANILWIMKSPEESADMNEEDIMAMLRESWEAFGIN